MTMIKTQFFFQHFVSDIYVLRHKYELNVFHLEIEKRLNFIFLHYGQNYIRPLLKTLHPENKPIINTNQRVPQGPFTLHAPSMKYAGALKMRC